jgi:hypothetical protein
MTSTRRKFLGSIAAVALLPVVQHLPTWEEPWTEAFWRWFDERFLGDIWPFPDLNDPWAWEDASALRRNLQ